MALEVDVAKSAGGVATALTIKLGQLLMQEYQLLSGLRGEVVLLRDDAAMMNALLRMFSETDEGAVDHCVREWMKQVSELSHDAEDCIDVFVRRISWASWVSSSLGRAWHRFATAGPRRRLAAEVEDLRARALAIGERHVLYGAYGQALQPSQAFGSRVPTSTSTPPVPGVANHDPGQFIGMQAQVDSLSDSVSAHVDQDQTLKVYSIVGLGGVGKSTLAMGVFLKLTGFDYKAVVPVSQEFDPSKDVIGLMQRIQKQFGYDDKSGKFEDHLVDKRYLVVIDDLWTTSAWNAMKQKLPADNNMQSRIIVTTRREDVATTCSSTSLDKSYIHRVDLLNYEDSRTLFVTRVFGQSPVAAQNDGQPVPDAPAEDQNDGQPVPDPNALPPTVPDPDALPPISDAPAADQNDDQIVPDAPAGDQNDVQPVPDALPPACPTELEDQMEIILQKCGGLPLAIVCIANVLARYNSPTSIDMWTRVCNSVGSQLETDPTLEGMMQIIALSYNHLPHRLKACAMLLSIYPEDYQISKRTLQRRWICEGLIPEKRGLTLLDVAEAYYDELMSRNIIQQGLGADGTASEKHCRVHDMMLEVIVSKSLDANFVSLVGSPRGWTSYDVVRRLSIHGDVDNGVDGMKMQHVRSLSSFGYKMNRPGKLLKQLAKFRLLRVLDLEDCKDLKDHHMKQVCKLILLTFLNLNETGVRELPSEISNLQHLQILWLYDTLLKKVPGSVVKLKKLEHLSFRNRDNPKIRLKLPRGLKNMKALQEMSQLQIRKKDVKLAEEIGHLVQLRGLKVFVPWGRSDKVREALDISVKKLCFLRGDAVIEYEVDPAQRDQQAQAQTA